MQTRILIIVPIILITNISFLSANEFIELPQITYEKEQNSYIKLIENKLIDKGLEPIAAKQKVEAIFIQDKALTQIKLNKLFAKYSNHNEILENLSKKALFDQKIDLDDVQYIKSILGVKHFS